jgi:hypothetical protein
MEAAEESEKSWPIFRQLTLVQKKYNEEFRVRTKMSVSPVSEKLENLIVVLVNKFILTRTRTKRNPTILGNFFRRALEKRNLVLKGNIEKKRESFPTERV